MFSIFLKEIKSFFNSIVAYIVITIFLTGIGLFMWVFPPTVFEQRVADMNLLFIICPYVFMFLIPAITMRSFAEEKKTGTMELLLTRPITDWQIVLGKFLAALVLVVFCLLPTLVYYYSIYRLGDPMGNIDSAAVFGSYIGLVLLGAVYTAIGIFMSSITDNQIVAFLLSLFLSLMFFMGLGYVADITGMLFVENLSLEVHYYDLSRGVLDIRNVIYLASIAMLFLYAGRLKLGSRNW